MSLIVDRFSKKKVANRIYKRIKQLKKQHDFNINDGWAQVQGKGEEINRDYGEYDGLCRLMEDLDLWGCVTDV